MSDNALENIDPDREFVPVVEEDEQQETVLGFLVFLLKLVVIVFVIRSFVIAPFSIPSESMQPRLINGDHLIASKWSYGFSNHSLPFGLQPFPEGRIFASQPERGDVAIFKHPLSGEDYIKRVIGLPGDEIQMKGGVLFINGVAVKKEPVADFEIEVSPNTRCTMLQFQAMRADGTAVCRYPQFRETLPNGVTYNVLDFVMRNGDDTQVYIVPQGQLFVMGDNRDNSLDSRFPASVGSDGTGGAVGILPQDLLVGKAQVMMWSTDGGAEWLKPWTWFTAARWSRIGGGI